MNVSPEICLSIKSPAIRNTIIAQWMQSALNFLLFLPSLPPPEFSPRHYENFPQLPIFLYIFFFWQADKRHWMGHTSWLRYFNLIMPTSQANDNDFAGLRGAWEIQPDVLGKLSLFPLPCLSLFFSQLMQIKVLCNFNELLPPAATSPFSFHISIFS